MNKERNRTGQKENRGLYESLDSLPTFDPKSTTIRLKATLRQILICGPLLWLLFLRSSALH
jgi:hypothetical protein